jgi:hypothetical protein
MTEIAYPPSTTVTLADALDDLEERVATLDEDDPDHRPTVNQRDALSWAVEEFGGDAEVVLTAYTAATRARVQDALRSSVVGDVGTGRTQLWLAAAGVDDAPWLSAGDDLATTADVTGQLPPALVDWLQAQLDDLNDLGDEGN